jgi:hypothetical protein
MPATLESSCRCEMCRPDDPAPTYTEAFRHECEARYVAALPSNDRRSEFLAEVLKARGDIEYYRLRSAAWNQMHKAGAGS